MQPVIRVDTRALEQAMQRMEHVLETESIPKLAKIHREMILGFTAKGADAYGEIFHGYAPSTIHERELLGLQVDIKDLRRSGGLLDSMDLQGNVLTVDDAHQKIALGQITGHSGDWGYEHNFMDLSTDSLDKSGDELIPELLKDL